MKLYLLRHEDRNMNDPTFFSPLTDKGKQNAQELKKILENLNITHVYSSPFIRTLQTIEPFIQSSGAKINIENGFMEGLQDPLFEKRPNIELPRSMYKLFHINETSMSSFDLEYCNYPETTKKIQERVIFTLSSIIKKNNNTDNILICTHKCICNIILAITTKETKSIDFKMGQLAEIQNNKYKLIN